MTKITLIGSGNVSQSLVKAFLKSDRIEICEVYTRTKKAFFSKHKILQCTNLAELNPNSDIYLICVNDDSITDIAKQFPFKNKIVAHTAGSVSIKVLANQFINCGVFYPLQTLSTKTNTDFNSVPFFIEANNLQTNRKLKALAKCISKSVFELSSDKRLKLHLSAVMVNNFTNHLIHLADEYLEKNKIGNVEILLPLIEQTVNKLNTQKAFDAQTGPARRGDQKTINNHLALLKTDKSLFEIYKIMSNSITKTYAKPKTKTN